MFLCLDNSRWNAEGHTKEYAKVVEMVTPYPFFSSLKSVGLFKFKSNWFYQFVKLGIQFN